MGIRGGGEHGGGGDCSGDCLGYFGECFPEISICRRMYEVFALEVVGKIFTI